MDCTPSLHILAPPPAPPDKEKEHCRKRMHLLESVEDILRRVVGLEGRLRLCSAFAELPSMPTSLQTSVFFDLLRHGAPFSSSQSRRQGTEVNSIQRVRLRGNLSACLDLSIARDQKNGDQVARQMLRMLCESRPRQVAPLLAHDSEMLCRFFSGTPKRALQWFQNFAGVGEIDHQVGARALARYVFLHRETAWHELVWKGGRSQAPATVASKPHYFSDLNVSETIDNFIDHVPSFWHSQELRDSLEDGQFIALDTDFFVEELLAKMDTDALSRVLKAYLAEESFGVLCQRILPMVSHDEFLAFINGLAAAMANWKEGKDKREEGEGRYGTRTKEPVWLEMALSAGVEWETLNDVIFCNACSRYGRELFRLMQSEEHEDERTSLVSLLADRNAYDEQEHWALRRECLLVQKWQAVQWLAMETWLLLYLLSQDSTSPKALETLMVEDGIGFLRTSVQHIDKEELDGKVRGTKTSKEKKRSRKRHRQKRKGTSRKKNTHSDDMDSDSGSDVPFETEELDRTSTVSWRLSIDNYTITWTKADVVEYVVNHALSRWLQWTTKRW